MPDSSPRPPCPLLDLPLELRHQIYTHLLPRQPTSHPLPSVGLTSVSHLPPTSAYLNIHPQLTDEILEHFYQITTWKIIFSHAFNFFRVDPDLKRLELSPALHRLRRVEVVVYCDILLMKGHPDFGLATFCAEICRRVKRAADVLLEAEKLHTLLVSWIDTTGTAGWESKAQILAPLRKLPPGVAYKIGNIHGIAHDGDRVKFTKAMLTVLGTAESKSVGGVDGANESAPASLRMLAFDVRQDRHLYANSHPTRFVEVMRSQAVTGTAGWAPIAF